MERLRLVPTLILIPCLFVSQICSSSRFGSRDIVFSFGLIPKPLFGLVKVLDTKPSWMSHSKMGSRVLKGLQVVQVLGFLNLSLYKLRRLE